MSKLAINGGTPLFKQGEYKIAEWPPVSEATADHIRELYFSRKWSFNSETEQAFEREFAVFHDAKYGIFMSNGTVTLECALRALGVGPGDEVIVPDLTWIATAMSVRYVGATCVFADIEKSTFCLDPASFEAAITPRTRAVIPVHLYGGMADLEKILAIAEKHGIAVIEDCAHMQGGKWAGKGCGSWGKIGSFSFQQSKALSCGEGGICITDDEKLADLMYRAKHIGYSRMDPQGHALTSPPPGLEPHNYRGLAIQAQILRDQLPEFPAVLKRYNEFRDILADELKNVEGLRLQERGRLATRQGYYSLAVVWDDKAMAGVTNSRIAEAVMAEGVADTLTTYGPVRKHLLFNMAPEHYRLPAAGCPNSDYICAHTVKTFHWEMYYPETAPRFAAALRKVAENIHELTA